MTETKGLVKETTGTVQAMTLGKSSGKTANGEVLTNGYSAIEFLADTSLTLKFIDKSTDVTVDVKEGSRYGISIDILSISFTGDYNIC